MSHTPEPWVYNSTHGWIEQQGAAGTRVILCQLWNRHDETFPNATANAQRIIACVNACAGLSHEALDAGIITDLLAALEAHRAMAVLPSTDAGIKARLTHMDTITARLDAAAAKLTRGTAE